MAGSADNVRAFAEAAPAHAVDEVVVERGVNCWVIRARKAITDHDPDLPGHFPGATVYPGVFVIESLRQAVSEGLGAAYDIVTVHSARFLMILVSGDVLTLDATAKPFPDGSLAVTASATVEHGDIPAAKIALLLSPRRAADTAAA